MQIVGAGFDRSCVQRLCAKLTILKMSLQQPRPFIHIFLTCLIKGTPLEQSYHLKCFLRSYINELPYTLQQFRIVDDKFVLCENEPVRKTVLSGEFSIIETLPWTSLRKINTTFVHACIPFCFCNC